MLSLAGPNEREGGVRELPGSSVSAIQVGYISRLLSHLPLSVHHVFIPVHTESSKADKTSICPVTAHQLPQAIEHWSLVFEAETLESSPCHLLAVWPWSLHVILEPQFPHL
jgi:hypothetical protein